MKQIFETDWLGSQPVFYNDSTGRASHNIHDVIDWDDVEFHPEGLNNFFDCSYSILGQTPVRHVKFLPHSSRLTVHENGRLEIEHMDDPAARWLGRVSCEDDVWHLLTKTVRDWEKSVEGEIIIPTSGGHDSRLLNIFIEDKTRIRSFTYGLAENQAASYEVVYAKKLSEALGTRWEQIPLGDFHYYFDDWDQLFGISTHAHGMYQMEFYAKIRARVQGGNPLLSGIIGDAWAGNVKIPAILSPGDVMRLAYSHSVAADSRYSRVACQHRLREEYYESHKDKLVSPLYTVIESMRFKLILLSYIQIVPAHYGFKPWSPFLMPQIALSMLTLPPERREKRVWQREFFRKQGWDFRSMRLRVRRENTLNYQALHRVPVRPLDEHRLGEVVQPEYVRWINKMIRRKTSWHAWNWHLLQMPKVGRVLHSLGMDELRLNAYGAYLTLRAVENLLIKRDQCRQSRG